jgi:hypothetical protein
LGVTCVPLILDLLLERPLQTIEIVPKMGTGYATLWNAFKSAARIAASLRSTRPVAKAVLPTAWAE